MKHDKTEREDFGKALAAIRDSKGLSQDAVAEGLSRSGYDVIKQTVSAWETGRNMPDVLVVRRLAKVLGVSANRIVAGSDTWMPADDILGAVLSLAPPDLRKLENLMRVHLGLTVQDTPPPPKVVTVTVQSKKQTGRRRA